LREKAHKESEIQKRSGRGDLPPIDVYGIAHRLKGIEGNTYRQDDILKGKMTMEKLV
jgi:hypothetical protein